MFHVISTYTTLKGIGVEDNNCATMHPLLTLKSVIGIKKKKKKIERQKGSTWTSLAANDLIIGIEFYTVKRYFLR